MIRGVNKNVIEISDTGNDCFEKAILFVRPESFDKGSDHVRKRAMDYLSGLKPRPWLYPRSKLMRALVWVGGAAAGAAVTALILLL